MERRRILLADRPFGKQVTLDEIRALMLAGTRARVQQKSNTSKARTHSLFRQRCMLYDLIPNMPEHRLTPLIQAFNTTVANAAVFAPALPVTK